MENLNLITVKLVTQGQEKEYVLAEGSTVKDLLDAAGHTLQPDESISMDRENMSIMQLDENMIPIFTLVNGDIVKIEKPNEQIAEGNEINTGNFIAVKLVESQGQGKEYVLAEGSTVKDLLDVAGRTLQLNESITIVNIEHMTTARADENTMSTSTLVDGDIVRIEKADRQTVEEGKINEEINNTEQNTSKNPEPDQVKSETQVDIPESPKTEPDQSKTDIPDEPKTESDPTKTGPRTEKSGGINHTSYESGANSSFTQNQFTQSPVEIFREKINYIFLFVVPPCTIKEDTKPVSHKTRCKKQDRKGTRKRK